MLPYIHIIIPSYSALAFIGGFTVLIFLYFRKDRFRIPFNDFLLLYVWCMVGVLIGSKLLFALSYPLWSGESVSSIPIIFVQGGYVFYGGLFGALVAITLWTKKYKIVETQKAYSLMAPAFPLFHGFGRIGCFLAGCCYGKTLSTPLDLGNGLRIAVVPTQLMESAYEFALFGVLLLVEKKKPESDLLRLYLLSYAAFRFIIEFVRGDSDRGFILGLSVSQWISLCVIFYYVIYRPAVGLFGKSRMEPDHL